MPEWIVPLTVRPRTVRVWSTDANDYADAVVPLCFHEWIAYANGLRVAALNQPLSA